jgi:hypothetical protein
MSENHITLTKLALNGHNWVSYRNHIEWVFNTCQWSQHLTEASVTQEYLNAGDIGGVTPQNRWAAEERTIKELISDSIPDSVFSKIKSKPNIREIWTTLRVLYESRTTMIIVNMTKRLQSTKCNEDDDIRAHFTKLDTMRNQLAAMGKSFTEEEYASIMLGSIPPSYTPTISSMNAAFECTGVPAAPDCIIKIITDKYNRQMIAQGKTSSGPNEAFTTQDQKIDRSNIECYNCHRKGHYKSECWAKGGSKEGQHPPRRNKDDCNGNHNCNNN